MAGRLWLFIALLGLGACGGSSEVDLEKDFEWMAGTWKLVDASSEVFEMWQWENGKWAGESYAAIQGMKVPTEKIDLLQEGTTIIYRQRVKDRLNGDPVDYNLTERSRRTFTFQTDTDIFPKEIIYTRSGGNGMKVEVQGNRDGEWTRIQLEYIKQE
jgi:hypothetical protein